MVGIWPALIGSLLSILIFLFFLRTAQKKSVSSVHGHLPTPPGSMGWPLVGETIAFLYDLTRHPKGMYQFIGSRHEKYGRIFRTSILGSIHVFAATEKGAKYVLTGDQEILFRYAAFKSLIDMVGKGSLLFKHGEAHQKLRRIIGDLVTTEQLRRYLPQMEEITLDTLDKWPQGTPFCVLNHTTSFAFRIICCMLFSMHKGPEVDVFIRNFETLSRGLISLPLNIPGTAYHKGLMARDYMLSVLDKIMARRRSGQEIHDDFLQSILFPNSEAAHEKLNDSEIKDNLLAMLIAGHTTSASSLMWAMKYLSENPDVLESLRSEHQEIQKKKAVNAPLTLCDTNNMPYTSKVIQETLRMSSIVKYVPRVPLKDVEVDGFQVKKGSTIDISIHAMHHDAKYFTHPQKFNPNRFDEPIKPFSYIPFGVGPRMCLGMHLARLEMSIFLHHLVTKYKWRLVDCNDALGPMPIPTLKNGCPIIVEPIG